MEYVLDAMLAAAAGTNAADMNAFGANGKFNEGSTIFKPYTRDANNMPYGWTAEIRYPSCPTETGAGLLEVKSTDVEDWADTILKQADFTASWADLGTDYYSQHWNNFRHEVNTQLQYSAFPGRRLHLSDPPGAGNSGAPDFGHAHYMTGGHQHATNGAAEVSFPKFSSKAGASWMLLKKSGMPTATEPVALCQFRSDDSFRPNFGTSWMTSSVTAIPDTRANRTNVLAYCLCTTETRQPPSAPPVPPPPSPPPSASPSPPPSPPPPSPPPPSPPPHPPPSPPPPSPPPSPPPCPPPPLPPPPGCSVE